MVYGTRPYRGVCAALLLAGAAWLTGCGSSGGSSGGAQVVGTVEAPSVHVARVQPTALDRIARAFTLGSPAEAQGAMNRRRVRGATVTIVRVHDGVVLGNGTTDSSGQFTCPVADATPGTICIVIARANGPGGPIMVRRIIRVGNGQQTVTVVNEASTVGAAVAEEVLGDGASPEEAADAADEATVATETEEQQDPTSVPDVRVSHQGHIREHARGHLQGNLDTKLALALTGTPSVQAVAQAIMAGQAYARVALGLSPEIHLSRAQVLALANLVVEKKSFTNAEVAAMLGSTEGDVETALGTLQARPRLTPIIGDLDGEVPAIVVILMAEQPDVPFHITTQEQLNALVNALIAPATAPGPEVLPDLDGDTTVA